MSQERVREFEKCLLMLYTGSSRMGGEIAATVISNLQNNAKSLRRMRDMVDEGAGILTSDKNLDAFGELLHESGP